MRTRHRPLALATIALLAAASLGACTSTTAPADPETSAATHHTAPPATSQAPAQETPQQRITGYLQASDDLARQGWKGDLSYNDEYLVPDLAKRVREAQEKNSQSGAVAHGERTLSDWTTVAETDTAATIEFCDDTTGLTATRDGEPVQAENETGRSVAQFELTRASASDPWLIAEKNYYPRETTCDAHFTH